MSGFGIDFLGRLGYEFLMAEITFRGQCLCELDRENGVDAMRKTFVDDLYRLPQAVEMQFPLANFLIVVEKARRALAGLPPE